MSSPDRRTLLLSLAALPLAGCGFQPVYGEGGAARGLYGRIRFNLIDSRAGFLLLEQLERRLGRPGPEARYDARIDLEMVEEELVLATASGLSRVGVNGAVEIAVTDARTGAEVYRDRLRETAGYTASAETAVTEASRRDAYDRLARAIAERIVERLAASAESWAG